MTHYSLEQWQKYVDDDLDEKVREVYEEHLYSCDQCLEVYFQAVAEQESLLPVLTNEADFTNQIMAQIEESKPSIKAKIESKKVVPFYQKAIFHYTLAAAMTLLLMTTGVFQSITNYVETVQSSAQPKSSKTEELVGKTFAWMDSFDTRNKEANK